jgi:hypothetical protein
MKVRAFRLLVALTALAAFLGEAKVIWGGD